MKMRNSCDNFFIGVRGESSVRNRLERFAEMGLDMLGIETVLKLADA